MKQGQPGTHQQGPEATQPHRKRDLYIMGVTLLVGWSTVVWGAFSRHSDGQTWLDAFGMNRHLLQAIGEFGVLLVLAILLAQTAMRLPKGRLRTVARRAAVMAMVFVPIWWGLLRPMLLAGP